jgi:hypothetical protein
MNPNSASSTPPPTSHTPIVALPCASHRLTESIIRDLRKPFEAELVKWKVQTNPREDSDLAVVVAYIDARDVAERLDRATNGDWSDDYAKPVVLAGGQHSLECRLTVCGVTRRDVGTVPAPRDGEDDTKNLYSDAFKRAAVKFGVAAHIYRFPNVMARVEKRGRTCFLTRDAERELYALAQLVVVGTPRKDWPRFTSLKVWGSVFGADGRLDLFDEQAEARPVTGEASFTPAPETVPLVTPAPAPATGAPAKRPRQAERRPSVATPSHVTTTPAPATTASAPATPAPPIATPPESPANAIVARVQVAREALATAEAKLGVRPAATAPDTIIPTPTVMRAGQVMASGTQAEQVVRAVAAIKAAYGKAGVTGVDDIGTSTGLFDLVTMTKQDLLGQKVTKTEADEVLRRLTELQERLDTSQESASALAEAGGYDLSAL